jgi:hypothetical protein
MRIEVSVPGITKELGKLSPRGAEARTTPRGPTADLR